jgi:hypothetical protein
MRRISPILMSALTFSSVSLVARAAPRQEITDNAFVTQPTQIWTEPGQFGTPIAKLEPGLKFETLTYSTSESWVKIRTPGGREGWVPVRFTSFADRRAVPPMDGAPQEQLETAMSDAESNEEIEGQGGDRSPASTKRVKRMPSASKNKSDGFLLGLRLEYANQLSREKSSGAGIGVTGMARLSPHFALGGGLDYQIFFESAQSNLSFSVDRVSHSFFPHVALAFLHSGFMAELGIGVDVDTTKITTKNLATVPPTVDPANSGTDSSALFAVALRPSYHFDLGGTADLGVHLLYKMLINMGSSYGPFASVNPASKVQHVIGIGASSTFDF